MDYLYLAVGAALVLLSSLFGGAALYMQSAAHVYSDLTVDLLPHVLLAGWILAVYGIWKLRRRYMYVSPSKSALGEKEE